MFLVIHRRTRRLICLDSTLIAV
ncbi:hypothetical protein LINGRAHAP2_LOCUS8988 [Linum grandiflorum]